MRAVGPALRLWDIENVEAFVKRAVDTGLAMRGAKLSPSQKDRCLQFCLLKCWELSGLEADGKTLRYVFRLTAFRRPSGWSEDYVPLRAKPFPTRAAADLALAELDPRIWRFARIVPVRPRGAYNPASGQRFSTYAWRITVNHRIDDWYRSDPEFGDTRYESNRRQEESLETLASRRRDDESVDGTPAPLGRLEVIDTLNQHAYQDAGEEVLTREAFGFGG
jgi:hypothetical protein